MMDYEKSESAQDNFGKFIHQLEPETKILIRKLERILMKLYRQNVSLLFNQTHRQTDTNTHTDTRTQIYIYIYIERERERERKRERERAKVRDMKR